MLETPLLGAKTRLPVGLGLMSTTLALRRRRHAASEERNAP